MKYSKNDKQPESIQADALVENAPSFSEGGAAISDHISAIRDYAWLPFGKYGAKDAEQHGIQDGKNNQDELDFQDKCRNAYRKVRGRVNRKIAEIVRREKRHIDSVIYAELPDMETQVERRIDRDAVTELVKAATSWATALRNQKAFLSERGLTADSAQTQRVRTYSDWRFWLPIPTILVIELLANFWFLQNAESVQKILIAITSVVVVFAFGFVISWARGVPDAVGNNTRVYKLATYLLESIVWVAFFVVMTWLVVYRAGDVPETFTVAVVASALGKAFANNPADLGLLILNFAFLVCAIHMFRNASMSGWHIPKFAPVANAAQTSKQCFDSIHTKLHEQSRIVFEESIADVERKLEIISELELTWPSIVESCKAIQESNGEITETITDRYEFAIKKYREGFAAGRQPLKEIDPDHPEAWKWVLDNIPEDVRVDSPIKPLASDDEYAKYANANLQKLIELDFDKKLSEFRARAEEWKAENSKFDKLNKFARRHIKDMRDTIKAEIIDYGGGDER